jgi:hypothetical protein
VTADQVQDGMLIQGTVMDLSPGKPNTPAISDENMSVWMDYLYGQNATMINSPPFCNGVPVTLTAVDSNGNSVNIGTTTSDGSGHFGYLYRSSLPGIYTIYATFAGSNSYYSSYGETSGAVTAASAATSTPSPQAAQSSLSGADLLTYLAIVTIVIVIAIAAATVLILRKH